MKKILSVVVAGACIGVFAASHAKLPPAPPKSEEQKKAEAEKAAATKAKDAEQLNKAMDKAVANYKKHKDKAASMGAAKK
jgi:gas vesicle protein